MGRSKRRQTGNSASENARFIAIVYSTRLGNRINRR
jgi:hypothetical protein